MGAAVDRFNTLYRGSTLYPHHGTHGLALPFGGPTAFRQNCPTTMTLSRPLRLTPHWAKSWVAPCLPQTPTTIVMEKRPHHGKTVPNGTKALIIQLRAHKVMSAYRARVPHAHNLPSLEAPVRGMTIDPVRTLP